MQLEIIVYIHFDTHEQLDIVISLFMLTDKPLKIEAMYNKIQINIVMRDVQVNVSNKVEWKTKIITKVLHNIF